MSPPQMRENDASGSVDNTTECSMHFMPRRLWRSTLANVDRNGAVLFKQHALGLALNPGVSGNGVCSPPDGSTEMPAGSAGIKRKAAIIDDADVAGLATASSTECAALKFA